MQHADLLSQITIASPCRADWERMHGSPTARHCGLCRKTVHNLSEMSRDEALAFLARLEGSACLRIYRRADGTILTGDCPVGARRRRGRLALLAASVLALLAGAAFALRGRRPEPALPGLLRRSRVPAPPGEAFMGVVCQPPQAPLKSGR